MRRLRRALERGKRRRRLEDFQAERACLAWDGRMRAMLWSVGFRPSDDGAGEVVWTPAARGKA